MLDKSIMENVFFSLVCGLGRMHSNWSTLEGETPKLVEFQQQLVELVLHDPHLPLYYGTNPHILTEGHLQSSSCVTAPALHHPNLFLHFALQAGTAYLVTLLLSQL